MDEMANREKILSAQHGYDNALPSQERQTRFTMPEIRSTQAGGSNTRRYRSTEAEQQAVNAVKGRGNGNSRDQGKGKCKTQRTGKQLYGRMPGGTYNV